MFLAKSLVTAHVTLSEASVNKNYKEVKSTAESYNKITKKKIFVDDSQNNVIDFEISRKIPMTKSSQFNEVLPESNMKLERPYQRKHKKINEEVDSQVNGLSKNNKVAVKKLTKNKDVNSVENIINNERTDKAPSGEKRVFIVGDGIIKHING